MSKVDFRIVYRGGEADQHVMDMRLLALSMLGAEKIVSDGLILLVHRRPPKRGERAPVVLKAREPQEGSIELITLLHSIFGTLNLGLPLAKDLAASFLEEWWKAVIARFSGKPDVAEVAIQAMTEITRQHLASRDTADGFRHEEAMAMIDLLRAAVAGQQRHAEQFVAPIGTSVDNATVLPSQDRQVLIGTADAEAIRDGAKLTWGPLEHLTLKTDGSGSTTTA